eukprot:30294-Pelagococcus_subviridis.AAC.106
MSTAGVAHPGFMPLPSFPRTSSGATYAILGVVGSGSPGCLPELEYDDDDDEPYPPDRPEPDPPVEYPPGQ